MATRASVIVVVSDAEADKFARTRYFHRDGTPVKNHAEGMQLWKDKYDPESPDYFRVENTQLNERVSVSTVYLVMDHSFRGVPPLIFESMTFYEDTGWHEHDMDRYATELDARIGHNLMVIRQQMLILNPPRAARERWRLMKWARARWERRVRGPEEGEATGLGDQPVRDGETEE